MVEMSAPMGRLLETGDEWPTSGIKTGSENVDRKEMLLCRFQAHSHDTQALGVIYTPDDKYVYGCEASDDHSADAETPRSFPTNRRVLFHRCASIAAHTPDYDPMHCGRDAECFIHNDLYIKQRNRRFDLRDYARVQAWAPEAVRFTPSHARLAGFGPFMRCLRRFVADVDAAFRDRRRPNVAWRALWLVQLYTTDAVHNEAILAHAIARTMSTRIAGDAVWTQWHAHKARWMADEASGAVASALQRLVRPSKIFVWEPCN